MQQNAKKEELFRKVYANGKTPEAYGEYVTNLGIVDFTPLGYKFPGTGKAKKINADCIEWWLEEIENDKERTEEIKEVVV